MADHNIITHKCMESTRAGLALEGQLSCGWVQLDNADRFIPAELDRQGIFEVEKSGLKYCESKQLIKIIEEHLKMVSDGRHNF